MEYIYSISAFATLFVTLNFLLCCRVGSRLLFDVKAGYFSRHFAENSTNADRVCPSWIKSVHGLTVNAVVCLGVPTRSQTSCHGNSEPLSQIFCWRRH